MTRTFLITLLILFVPFFSLPASNDTISEIETEIESGIKPEAETGYASWYGGKFQGRRTANGEVFDTNLLTAAHKTLPFNTIVEVKNLENGKTVEVRINDRGPFVEGRIIDLSRAAAAEIQMVGTGIASVEVRIVREPDNPYPKGDGTYIIQAASFSNEGNARNAADRISSRGLSPSIEKAPSGHLRVILNKVPEDLIDETREILKQLGFPNALVRFE